MDEALLRQAGAIGLKLLRLLPPETAHGLTLRALAAGFAPGAPSADDPILATNLWGLGFPNPIGLAAGFDKNARVPDAMLRWGFGFSETGTVTPLAQPGNPLPRLFRLPENDAVINRLGFNNAGLAAAAGRLAARRRIGIVGANLGKNKDSPEAEPDYRKGVAAMAPLADYLVINISSPNTPGLRDLQRRAAVGDLIRAVLETRDGLRLSKTPPLLVKIAPDLSAQEAEDIAEVALETGIDGLIVSNTTIDRPASLKGPHIAETGGLSGRPLLAKSTDLLARLYRLTGGKVILIGVGGVASGEDAYRKIRAGASLVQLYTALVYRGPALVSEIKRDLAALLRRDGFADIAAAVGAG